MPLRIRVMYVLAAAVAILLTTAHGQADSARSAPLAGAAPAARAR